MLQAELLRDRRRDEKEDGEVESIQRPAHPGGAIGIPLVLGGFFSPRKTRCGSALPRHCFRRPLIVVLFRTSILLAHLTGSVAAHGSHGQ